MPYPFVLPTTSAFVFTTAFDSPTHPSLPSTASTYRSVVRDTLKRHKRMPPETQSSNLGLVVSSLEDYLPYLIALADGLAGRRRDVQVSVLPQRRNKGPGPLAAAGPESGPGSAPAPAAASGPALEWRPVLAEARLPGKEPPRVRIPLNRAALDAEAVFVLAALGHAYTLQARAALQPLYVVTSVVPVGSEQRKAALATALKHLQTAAGVFSFATTFAESSSSYAASASPSPEVSASTLRSLAALALAEATLLAVLKDDPYPAAVAQDRNEHDREWMYKAPDLPKVRAHLYARLCLAAAEHAARAASGVSGVAGISRAFVRYLQDLRHTSRAKACRFFAIDADLGGQTGTALAWVHGALLELRDGSGGPGGAAGRGSASPSSSPAADKKSLLDRFKKDRAEKREKKEDKRVERGAGWGGDAGRLEETRVLAMLDAKWTKQNDTVNTQRIPPAGPLVAQMPSGREFATVQPMVRPQLDASVLEAMRAPRDPLDALGDEVDGVTLVSSDDEGPELPTSGRQSAAPSSYF
ncbi:pH-response regulator protein palC [Sporothrix brasiliensis 5110]|uniref:pH-response regulator protein palC n=1 Tax=Sporothrix brasiliensis 5110 TaxID=1398154 RepID=A0A0C2JD99_9PEZI|nr:pH-response regulator protein palC [Sporothrix brasiliensis 5110]KIH94927.1 pH-response regulator protein palC [Sporothrix brasiliensis 5110]